MKKIIIYTLCAIILMTQSVSANTETHIRRLINTLETKGSITVKVKEAKELKTTFHALTRNITESNKSSIIIDAPFEVMGRQREDHIMIYISTDKDIYKELDEEIVTFFKDLKSDKMLTTEDKVDIALDFVVDSLEYSEANTHLKDAFKTSLGNCKVYTSLFARILEYMDIQHRPVYSTLHSTKEPHVHSAVLIDKKWVHIDSTHHQYLDSSKVYSDREKNLNIMGVIVPDVE